MNILTTIGGFIGGLFGLGSDSSQADTNAQLQAQIDADNKRDKTQSIIGLLALGLSIVALWIAIRKK